MSTRGLEVNASKSKVVVVLGGEKEWGCQVCVEGIRLEDASEFKYSRCFGRIGYR